LIADGLNEFEVFGKINYWISW